MKNEDVNHVNKDPGSPAGSQPGSASYSTGGPSANCATAASRPKEYVAPRNEVEAGVAEILATVLAAARVGIYDNFILLGGESLLAAQVAWRIQKRFGCEVSLRSILAGSVADIAAELVAQGCNSAGENFNTTDPSY